MRQTVDRDGVAIECGDGRGGRSVSAILTKTSAVEGDSTGEALGADQAHGVGSDSGIHDKATGEGVVAGKD